MSNLYYILFISDVPQVDVKITPGKKQKAGKVIPIRGEADNLLKEGFIERVLIHAGGAIDEAYIRETSGVTDVMRGKPKKKVKKPKKKK